MFSNIICDATKARELQDWNPELEVSKETLAILNSFNEGYSSGYSWPDAWKEKPGGPWVYTCSYNHKSKDCEFCVKAKQSLAENLAWKQGWNIGYAKKLQEGRKNPIITNRKDNCHV